MLLLIRVGNRYLRECLENEVKSLTLLTAGADRLIFWCSKLTCHMQAALYVEVTPRISNAYRSTMVMQLLLWRPNHAVSMSTAKNSG